MDTVVSARPLGKTIGDKTILRDISVDVAQGNVVGVLGKNGAGKTTLLEVLLGLSPATTGTATLFGAGRFNLPVVEVLAAVGLRAFAQRRSPQGLPPVV